MANWTKLFSNFVWKNRPDTSTPLGQTLLNRLNTALNGIDDRVVALNSQKVSTDEIQGVFTDVRLIKNTGQFVFTLFDGTQKIIDTALEKISINVSFDKETQMMVLEKDDGSKEYIDLSVFTTQYEFVSSPTIQQTVTDGKVRADIKPNSITDQMLQTNYLADITTQANTAVSASQSALESQSLAEQSAEDADRHADRAEAAADRAEAITGFTVDTNLDKNSSNPIANKAVAEALENVDAKTLDGHGADYFLPKTGGTVGRVSASPLELENTGGDDVFLAFRNQSKVLGMLGFMGDGTPRYYTSDWTKAYQLLHTGNKPSGTYTGNGSTEQRAISVGGIGTVLHVYSPTHGTSSIVTPYGAIKISSNGSITGFSPSVVRFIDGSLIIKTNDAGFNESGDYKYVLL